MTETTLHQVDYVDFYFLGRWCSSMQRPPDKRKAD